MSEPEAMRSWAAMVREDLDRLTPLPGSHEYALMSHLYTALDHIDSVTVPDPTPGPGGLSPEETRQLAAISAVVEACGDQPGAFGVLMAHHLRFLVSLAERNLQPSEASDLRAQAVWICDGLGSYGDDGRTHDEVVVPAGKDCPECGLPPAAPRPEAADLGDRESLLRQARRAEAMRKGRWD